MAELIATETTDCCCAPDAQATCCEPDAKPVESLGPR